MAWLWEELESGDSIALIVIIYIIAAIISFLIARTAWCGNSCILRSPGGAEWDYYVQEWRGCSFRKCSDNAQTCLMSFWALSHIILYAALGFVAPKRFFLIYGIGALWEVTESFMGMHCLLDLIWNLIGFTIGVAVRQLFYPPV